jgi:signal transduction histidine kinase
MGSGGPWGAWGVAAAWVFASLALCGVGGLAYGLGSLRARRQAERGLREARAEVRTLGQLRQGWQWQTDARHKLLIWQAPGGQTSQSCALFEKSDTALMARLRSMQPFTDLHLHSAAPLEGAQSWRLQGVPRHDDLGAFAGFVGQAVVLDAVEQQQALARALPPLLQACPVAAVVALQAVDGSWQRATANDAARLLWPRLNWPDSLDAVMGQLPAAAATAVRAALAGAVGPAQAAGWRVERFGEGSGGSGLVLAQAPAVQPSGSSPAATEGDSFSFTAAHDLRAPIRVVEGFTRIVKEDYGHLLDRVGNDHLERVLSAAARMNLMIDALLTLARLNAQPLGRQPVNLTQLAGFVVDDLRRAAPEREADIDIEPALTAVGDPTLLRLVLENLLGNAWKYSAKTPRARISLQSVPHESGLAYVVRDNGAGFDMRSADRLFGLFQRLHSASDFPGHGVGLASVRRIVNRHGGEIWAESEPGLGSAFSFTLGS